MSTRVIAICDICGAEQEFKTGPECDWERELNLEGWWSRADFSEICPKHPEAGCINADYLEV